MSKEINKKCECCGEVITDINNQYHIYYYLEPTLEYNCCKTCMLNGNIPYYGLIGLLTLVNQAQLDLPCQEIQRLKELSEKKNKNYSEDIKKAVEIYIEETSKEKNNVEKTEENKKETNNE